MSPNSMILPNMNNWDITQAMSPYATPDMNSIVSGSMMSTNYANHNGNNSNNTNNPNRNNNHLYEFQTPNSMSATGDYGQGPLSHLSDSVNSLEALNAMEKTIGDQVRFFVIFI